MTQTTIGIEGMMCGMCEAHINDAIRRNFDVRSAKSNRRKGVCVVVSPDELDPERVASVVGELGYKVTSMDSRPHKGRLLGLFGTSS